MYLIWHYVSIIGGNIHNMHIRKLHHHHLLKHLEGAFIRTLDTFRNSDIVSFYQINVVCILCIISISWI